MSRLTGLIFAGMIALTPVLAWAQGGTERFSHYGGGRMWGGGQSGPVGKSPQDILKERYARGEMTTKEFEERRKVLGD